MKNFLKSLINQSVNSTLLICSIAYGAGAESLSSFASFYILGIFIWTVFDYLHLWASNHTQ